MTKHGSIKKLIFAFLLALFSFALNESVFSQVDSAQTDDRKFKLNLNASLQYRNIAGELDIVYYGLSPEFYVSDKFNISGLFYIGKGSDNLTYVHIPIGGILIAIFTWSYFHMIIDAGDLFYYTDMLKFLLTENIQYHFLEKEKIRFSFYLSILGFDASETYGSVDDQNAMLSNGLGIIGNVQLTKHLTFDSFLDLKHFYATGKIFNSKNYEGFTTGINLGYVF